jgi:germacradienol/geosmin synthase
MPYVDHRILTQGFFDPPPHVVNLHIAEADDEAIAWLWKHSILTHTRHEAQVRSFDIGTITGASLPDAGPECLALVHKGMCWFILIDDQMDSTHLTDAVGSIRTLRQAIHSVLDRPQTATAVTSPHVRALADLWSTLQEGCTAHARHRFVTQLLGFFDGIERQALYVQSGQGPDFLEFLAMRRATVGMPAWAEFLAAALHLHLPDPVRDHYLMHEIIECSTDIQAIAQDIHSWEQEELEGHFCNIIPVLMTARGCTFEEAVQQAFALHRERQQTLLRAEREVPALMDRLGYRDQTTQALQFVRAVKGIAFAMHYWFASPANRRYDLDRPHVAGSFDIQIPTSGPSGARSEVVGPKVATP